MSAKEGWGWPVTSDRWHYFRYSALHAAWNNGMDSLCGAHVGFTGELHPEPEKEAEVCKVCLRMKGARRA